MKKLLLTIGLGSMFLMTGCTQRLGEFTVSSTQNVKNLETTSPTVNNHVKGESCIHYITIFPVGNFQNRIQEAEDEAIMNGRKAGVEGDLLLNTRIYVKHWYIPLLYGQDCVIVEGDLVKVKK